MNQEKLLKAIESNARYSTEDLARMLEESEENVAASIKELEDNKTICGYNTVINYDKSPFETVTAVIEVGCTPRRDTGYEEIAKEIYSYDEVSTMYLMSGKSEFIVIIKGKTMKEVASFVTHHLAPIDNVTRTETYFVLKQYKVEGIEIGGERKEDERLLFKL
ncbi:MAG: Lrp/AsnC family transcriptional regulator [Erysipelotrichaceae bacterium]|nr:Lrp/AsnC family transcriptional regulator [Erysipelotrichaceae bacterium]